MVRRPSMLSSSAETPAFTATALHRHFAIGRHRLDVLTGVELTVPRGEWVALAGASGCGKTTLLHLLGGLDRPDAGDVLCLGHRYGPAAGTRGAERGRKRMSRLLHALGTARNARFRRDKLGFVFQAYYLLPELNALENVVLPALQWRRNRAAQMRRAAELLTDFGLGERVEHRPQELSGGEQQRVALARALINDPEIILADEPTGNLDRAASDRILGILHDLHSRCAKTIVMVTHDRQLANQADRVLELRGGMVQSADDRNDLGSARK